MSKTITLRQIKALGACHGQVERFRATFGTEVTLTAEIVAEHCFSFDVDWAARNLLTAPAFADYEQATAPAWADYKRVKAAALFDLL